MSNVFNWHTSRAARFALDARGKTCVVAAMKNTNGEKVLFCESKCPFSFARAWERLWEKCCAQLPRILQNAGNDRPSREAAIPTN